jgi:hypothetical protein
MAGDTQRADESTLTRADGESERRAGRDRQASPDAAEARACMPCRGTGVVSSNLGGTRSELPCPWCGGTGVRQPGVDAQQHRREQAGAEASSADSPAGGS